MSPRLDWCKSTYTYINLIVETLTRRNRAKSKKSTKTQPSKSTKSTKRESTIFCGKYFLANFKNKAFTKFGINFTSFAILLLFLLYFDFFSSETCIQKVLHVNNLKQYAQTCTNIFLQLTGDLHDIFTYISNQMTNMCFFQGISRM